MVLVAFSNTASDSGNAASILGLVFLFSSSLVRLKKFYSFHNPIQTQATDYD